MAGTGQPHTIASGGRLQMRLADTMSAVSLARRAVDVLAFSISESGREKAQLVVSELVTNGLKHGKGGVTLSLAVSARGRLSGEVVDEGDGFVAPPPDAVRPEPGGWGLGIVASLAETWGIQRGTTRVWFAMPFEAEAA